MSLGGSVLGAASGAALPSVMLERVADANALNPGRLDRMCWRVMQPLTAPSVRPLAAVSSRGVRELVAVNDGLCPYGGALQRPVTVPEGVSTARLRLRAVALQSGDVSTGPLTIELRNATGTSVVISATHTPTATSTDVVTDAVAVAAETEYLIRLCCNESGQSKFVCGTLTLEPVTVTDSTWSNFIRLDVAPETLHDCVADGPEYTDPRFADQNQFARLVLLTDARSLVTEVYDNANDALTNRGRFGVFIDGYPIDPVATEAGRTNHIAVDLPAGGRRIRQVEVWSGPQIVTELPAPRLNKRGTFLAAVYLPRSAYVDVLPESQHAAGRTISMLVDSKGSGYYSSNPGIDSLVPSLRRAGIRVISYGAGGDGLYSEVGADISVEACLPLARKLARKRPDEIIIQIGRNDFLGGPYTAAELVTQVGNLADAIHQVDPRVLVTIATWTREVTESAVGGVAWDTERDNMAALATSRSDWCRVRPWADLWTLADAETYTSTDDVHLSDVGQSKIAREIIGLEHPWSPLQVTSLAGWWELEFGAPGGAPGAATVLTGSSPPTITLTGTSTIACRVIIDIETSGARGVARFRWGIWHASGTRWIQQGLLTAATVELAGLGVTVNFPTGTYLNNVSYSCAMQISGARDLGPFGRHLTGNSAFYPDFAPIAIGDKPAGLFTPTDNLRAPTLNIPAPYTILAVAQMGSNAARAIIGKSAAGSGMLLYCNAGGTSVLANDGSVQISAAATMTNANCFIVRVNGASSSIRVNGTQTNGTLNNVTLASFWVGSDQASGFGWDKWIRRIAVFSSAISDQECRAVEAWCRADLGTP